MPNHFPSSLPVAGLILIYFQGSACAVFKDEFILYGGWTSTWNTIRNDLHVLRLGTGRSNAKEQSKAIPEPQKSSSGGLLHWVPVSCDGDYPPPSYGSVAPPPPLLLMPCALRMRPAPHPDVRVARALRIAAGRP